ncbi:hypothetical protein [Azospirillum doebereinerae]
MPAFPATGRVAGRAPSSIHVIRQSGIRRPGPVQPFPVARPPILVTVRSRRRNRPRLLARTVFR